MSSSFLDSVNRDLIRRAGAMLVFALPAGAAIGADTYVQPVVELRAESSSNPNMDPVTDSDSDTYGSIADLSALFGIATPKGETTIRPRVRLQEYADRDQVEPVEGFLDIRSRYAGQRSVFEMQTKYSHRDSFTAELADAEFPVDDPDDPTTPETGNNDIGLTRQHFQIRPRYTHDITERANLGGELLYQGVRYSGEAALNRVDYDFSKATGFFGWAVTPRHTIGFGGYASKYEAKNFVNETDAYGATLSFAREWSESANTSFEVSYERNDIVSDVAPFEEETSGVGANLVGRWVGEVSEWRVVAGRTFTPTGRGGKSTSDQLRIQYDRQFSERFRMKTAARFLSDNALNDAATNFDRDYGRFEFSLEWSLSQTWFMGGGYELTYQDLQVDPEAAEDHRFFLTVGYRGLGRERQ